MLVDGPIGEPVIAGTIHKSEIIIEITNTITLAIFAFTPLFLPVANPIIARITATGTKRIFNSGIIPIEANTMDKIEHVFAFFFFAFGAIGGSTTVSFAPLKLLPQFGQNFAFSAKELPQPGQRD